MKYISRKPKADYDEDAYWDNGPMINQITVDDRDDYEPTGLLDKDGNELCRVRQKVGF